MRVQGLFGSRGPAVLIIGIIVISFASTAFTQAVIPRGSTIKMAEFSIWAEEPTWAEDSWPGDSTGWTVTVHRVNADWGENSVTWNSFSQSFDPSPIASFVVDHRWNTVDITPMVQSWVEGSVPNFGLYLEQQSPEYSRYFSSDFEEEIEYHPRLDIWFMDPSGIEKYVVIQRLEEAPGGVADAYIWEQNPDQNHIFKQRLFTGTFDGGAVSSLVRFEIVVAPGTKGAGFWKNHPSAWPFQEVEIGGITYRREHVIEIMKRPAEGNKEMTMFSSLVASKLNVLAGNDKSCIEEMIRAADEWIMGNPVGSAVRAGGGDSPWRKGEEINKWLQAYNHGRLDCVEPAR